VVEVPGETEAYIVRKRKKERKKERTKERTKESGRV